MMFWDSSAIIPLCLTETSSATMRKLFEKDSLIAVWWGTQIECCSAFARLRREKVLSDQDERYAKVPLHELAKIWTEINPGASVRDYALRLLATHPVKSADALQLAAALVWAGRSTHGAHFVCLDRQLRIAAQKEGFTVLPTD
jgi:hypothetical protein